MVCNIACYIYLEGSNRKTKTLGGFGLEKLLNKQYEIIVDEIRNVLHYLIDLCKLSISMEKFLNFDSTNCRVLEEWWR